MSEIVSRKSGNLLLTKDLTATPARRVGTRLTALIVASALFMEQLDSTVLSTALPDMARSFGADPLHMNVALTAYLLSLAVFIPVSGKIADRFWHADGVSRRDRVVHAGLDPVRPVDDPVLPDRLAHPARDRRRDDGAGGAAGAAALGRQDRAGLGDGLAADPVDDRPGGGDRRSAASSRRICPGAGSSTSTCRSALPVSCW